MADFTSFTQRNAHVQNAMSVLNNLRNIYQSGKQIQAAKALYQGNSDPSFNAVMDAIYTNPQFAELGAMINQILPIITDWETNHKSAIGVE